MEELERINVRKRELFWALRSRILTEQEMEEVTFYGKYINIEPDVCYNQTEKYMELNAALLQQFKMRLLTNKANGG